MDGEQLVINLQQDITGGDRPLEKDADFRPDIEDNS